MKGFFGMIKIAIVAAGLSLQASAELFTTKWIGTSGGSWNDPDNWSAGVPAADKIADFSEVSDSPYYVDVPTDVVAGGLRFGAGEFFLGGGAIEFSLSGADAFVEIAAGGCVVVSNELSGAGNLVKCGAGVFGALIQNFNYEGRTIVDEGTLHPLYGNLSGEFWLGLGADGVLVTTNGVLELTHDNLLANEMPITLDGGTFLQGTFREFIGKLTMRHGANFIGSADLVVYDDDDGHICADGGGDAGHISAALMVTTIYGDHGKGKFNRTQYVDVAADTTLAFSGSFNDYSYSSATEYAGNVRKMGEGTLVFEKCVSDGAEKSIRGRLLVDAGRVVFSNENVFARMKMDVVQGSAERLAFVAGANTVFGGLDVAAGETLDLCGSTFTIGGEAVDGGEWKGSVVNGKIVKDGVNTTRVVAPLNEVAQLEIRGGSFALDGMNTLKPLICWTFDDKESPGRDEGTLQRHLPVGCGETDHVRVVEDADRGAVLFFDGTSAVEGIPSDGLPKNTAFTITGWMKSSSASSGLLYWGQNAKGKSGGFGLSQRKPTFYFYGGGDLAAPYADRYADGKTWTHFACVFDPAAAAETKMRVYVDGTLAAQMDNTTAVDMDLSYPLVLGRVTANASRTCSGSVDDVMIFGRALTEEEISVVKSWKSREPVGVDYLPRSTVVHMEKGGTLSVGIANQTLSTISGDGRVMVADGATATFMAEESMSVGTVTGAGTAVKTGAAPLTLSCVDGLAGRVVVNEGEMVLNGLLDPEEHTVVHYTFDGADPGEDFGTAGLQLVPISGAWTDLRSNAGDGYIRFNGVDKALVPAATSADAQASLPSGNASWTVAYRFTLDSDAPGRAGFYSWGNASARSVNGARMYDATEGKTSKFGFIHYNWGADVSVAADPDDWHGVPPDDWHTVVITYDASGNRKEVYFDGANIASQTLPNDLAVVAANFTIGRSVKNGGFDWFKGCLDDFRVLDCALTPEQVVQLYAGDATASARITVSSGAALRVTTGGVAVGDVSAQGMVSVDGVLHLTQGKSDIRGILNGGGRICVENGAELELEGEGSFDGTVHVKRGILTGDWRLPAATVLVGAGGTLCAADPVACLAKRFSLMEGMEIDFVVADGWTRTVLWKSQEPILLPQTLSVKSKSDRTSADPGKAVLFSAPSLRGDISGWVFETSGFLDGFKKGLSPTNVWCSWGRPGLLLFFR